MAIKFFDEGFVKQLLRRDTWDAILQITAHYWAMLKNKDYKILPVAEQEEWRRTAACCLLYFARSRGITLQIDEGQDITALGLSQDQINAGFRSAKDMATTQKLSADFGARRRLFAREFGGEFFYEFSDGDLERVQALINELRDLITKSEAFKGEHKQRVLRRLEKLQSELHKKMPNLDCFWGILLEFGAVLQRLGEDVKPLVDRIREIADVVWGVQNRGLELPSNLPLKLPGDEPTKDKDPEQKKDQ